MSTAQVDSNGNIKLNKWWAGFVLTIGLSILASVIGWLLWLGNAQATMKGHDEDIASLKRMLHEHSIGAPHIQAQVHLAKHDAQLDEINARISRIESHTEHIIKSISEKLDALLRKQ